MQEGKKEVRKRGKRDTHTQMEGKVRGSLRDVCDPDGNDNHGVTCHDSCNNTSLSAWSTSFLGKT